MTFLFVICLPQTEDRRAGRQAVSLCGLEPIGCRRLRVPPQPAVPGRLPVTARTMQIERAKVRYIVERIGCRASTDSVLALPPALCRRRGLP
jgi:hypothetical protein